METPGVKKGQKKTKKSKRRSSNSSDGMFEDGDNAEVLPNSAPAESDMLGNSLSGMSKDEMRRHYELCMRLAAENKITLKNSFGLHLIGIMKQMVSESTDLQLASLSLAASSKIYSGRVEALYKDTVQFHTSLQTMFTTGKKNKKEEMETNDDEEDPSEKRKSKYNKYKSYLTNPETISIDSFGNSSLMPHPNFVVINSAFSANRSATKLVSLPLESDSNKLAFPSASCFGPEKAAPSEEDQAAETEPVNEQVFAAPKLLKVQLEKVLHMKPQTFEEMEAGHISMYRPPSPSPPFEAPSNDDYSVFDAEPNADDNNGEDMDGVIDRFSILNITVDAFTNAISKAVTSDCSLDVTKLPENSALRTVLKKPLVPKSTTKQKREVKVKEPFFNGERPVAQKTLFMEGKKSSAQAAFSDWSVRDTSIFFETDAYELNLPEDSMPTIAEICSFPFWYFSDKKEVDIPFFIKPMEPFKQPWNSFGKDAQDKNRRSSFGRVIEGRSNLSDLVPEDLAQSFRDLNLNDSGDCGGDDPAPGSPAPPLEEMILSGGEHPSDWQRSSLLEEGENSLPMPDVQSIMVQPPQVVRHINMRHEMVQNNLNMEKGKDIVWSLISSHLDKKESVLMSEIHQELGTVVKSLSSSNQLYSLGTCIQFTFVILLILANEKTLLLANLEDTNDITIKKDFREVEAVEGVLA